MGIPRGRELNEKRKGDSTLNIKTEFTEPECERFRRDCNFTDEERKVFDLRVKAKSIVQIQMETGLSEATVNRRIRNIKKKIYKVL